MSDEQPKQDQAVPTLEVQRAWALPTLHSNRFIISAWPDRMRLAFGEQVVSGQQSSMHVAVSMSIEDAVELANMIKEYARRNDPTLETQDKDGE